MSVPSQTLELLWETANRSQDQVLQAISDLDTKAGSLIDFSALVTGLYVLAGIGIPDLLSTTGGVCRYLAIVSLGLGFGTGLTALLIAMTAWRMGIWAIFNLPPLLEKLESESPDSVRAFVISQLKHHYARNVANYNKQKKRVNLGIKVLGVSVANVGLFITLAALTIAAVCP